tara:strand:- start:22 stop:309 length:288 start_codon:yes stop_codon:yes gene_type:complete
VFCTNVEQWRFLVHSNDESALRGKNFCTLSAHLWSGFRAACMKMVMFFFSIFINLLKLALRRAPFWHARCIVRASCLMAGITTPTMREKAYKIEQ